MSTHTDDIREIFKRAECGLAKASEVQVLRQYIEDLVWRVGNRNGIPAEVCRHCGVIRGMDHAVGCVAREVA